MLDLPELAVLSARLILAVLQVCTSISSSSVLFFGSHSIEREISKAL